MKPSGAADTVGPATAEPGPRTSVGARRSEATEAAVLDAAAALIAESGYGALTMEAVAKRARAGKATLYRWWPSKAHLALALVSRAKVEMSAPASGTLRDDLITYMGEVVALWRGEGQALALGPLIRVLYAEAWSDPAMAKALNEERRLRWVRLDEILAEAQGRGEVSPHLDLPRAKDLAMSWPFYQLMTNQLPGPEGIARMVDDFLPALTAPRPDLTAP